MPGLFVEDVNLRNGGGWDKEDNIRDGNREVGHDTEKEAGHSCNGSSSCDKVAAYI